MDFIKPEEFIQQALEKFAQVYICHVIMIEDCSPYMQLSQTIQISTAIAQWVILREAYKNFKDVFSIENAGYLTPHKDHDHAIDLIDNKQPPYGPIYQLSKKELSIFWAYIDKYLANRFIKPSKSVANTPIFFISKPNRGLRLCVNYQGLNNLIIKNWYPLLLVDKSLDRLGQAKQFTKLDQIDIYYWIRIKKGNK